MLKYETLHYLDFPVLIELCSKIPRRHNLQDLSQQGLRLKLHPAYLTTVRKPIDEAGFGTINKVATVGQVFRPRVLHDHLKILYSTIEMCPIVSSKGRSWDFPRLVIIRFFRVPQLLPQDPRRSIEAVDKALPVVEIVRLLLSPGLQSTRLVYTLSRGL